MALDDELDKTRPAIRTDSYAMSIGEWASLYEKKELDIHPEFQRVYRWKNHQKSKLIESILLGIPIPPIFVSQRRDGVWDVVDGVQRLSTIFGFMGILRNENDEITSPLTLEETNLLPSLINMQYEAEDKTKSLDQAQQLYFKRAKLDVNIVLPESDDMARFELFQRLNTGGTPLSDQEMRNCILVQINPEFYEWLKELSDFVQFKECVILTDRAKSEQYDLELALRFIVFRRVDVETLADIGDLGEYLTNKMIELAGGSFDYRMEREAFERTFNFLYENTKENSFRRYDVDRQRFSGGFLITPYEVFALGLGHHYANLDRLHLDIEEKIIEFWTNLQRGDLSIIAGSGVRARQRIRTTIAFGREQFGL